MIILAIIIIFIMVLSIEITTAEFVDSLRRYDSDTILALIMINTVIITSLIIALICK